MAHLPKPLRLFNMNLHTLFCGFAALFMVSTFVPQPCLAQKLVIDLLDESSQSNVIVTVSDWNRPGPCPSKYTNLLSNTNLFTRVQQELLVAIPAKYRQVATNSAPPGSVLVRLNKVTFGDTVDKTGKIVHAEGILGHFAYTNSEAREDVLFSTDGREKTVKYQAEPSSGYYARLIDNSLCDYEEFKDGKLNGLFTGFYQDRCYVWLCFTNGKALGKCFLWGRRGLGEPVSSGLAVEAEFKEPYDFLKYQQMRFDLTWMDSPSIITNANTPAAGSQPLRQ